MYLLNDLVEINILLCCFDKNIYLLFITYKYAIDVLLFKMYNIEIFNSKKKSCWLSNWMYPHNLLTLIYKTIYFTI